jgi:hypothetical protein
MNFSNTPMQAFKNGFLKGFSFGLPLKFPKREFVKMIEPPDVSIEDAIKSDLEKIGLDFKNVIRKFN